MSVLVLNADLSYHSVIPRKKAIKNILKGVYEVLQRNDANTKIFIKGVKTPYTMIVKLIKFIRGLYNRGVVISKKNILIRDNYVCAYCGEKATEVEHIIPKSKGGKITWENAVASCSLCNRKKADRTPREAGMFIKYCRPIQPTVSEFVAKKSAQMGITAMILDFFQEMMVSNG